MESYTLTTYKPVHTRNPFPERQDTPCAELLQDALKDKTFWKYLAGGGFLLLFCLSIIMLLYAFNRQQAMPVLVNVLQSGAPQYLGEIQQDAGIQVPETAIQWQMRKFITNLRSIGTDPQIIYNNIDECYFMITSSYKPFMTDSLRSDPALKEVGKLRRSVEIGRLLKTTAATYQVDWNEMVTDSTGTRKTIKMRALITFTVTPPNEKTIKRNPLGIYIENCEMIEL